jgi:hypothetical protein
VCQLARRNGGHAPAARTAKRARSARPAEAAEQFAVRVAGACALDLHAYNSMAAVARNRPFLCCRIPCQGCATRSAGCARASVPLRHRASASQSSLARRPRPAGTAFLTDNEVSVAAHLLPRLLPVIQTNASSGAAAPLRCQDVPSSCTIKQNFKARSA